MIKKKMKTACIRSENSFVILTTCFAFTATCFFQGGKKEAKNAFFVVILIANQRACTRLHCPTGLSVTQTRSDYAPPR